MVRMPANRFWIHLLEHLKIGAQMDRLGARWGRWVASHRVATLVVVLVVAASASLGTRYVGFTNDYRAFFAGDDPHLIAFEDLQDTYTRNDTVLFVIAPQEDGVFTRTTLAAVSELTERAWQTPFSIRVDSLSNYQHTRADGDDLIVADLYEDAASLTRDDLERIRNIAVNEPVLINRLISGDSSVTAINITVELPGIDEATEGPQVVAHVRQMREYAEKNWPHLKVYLTGIVMMDQAFSEVALYDLTHLIPIAFAIVLLLVFLQVRGLASIVATFIVIALAVTSAMGLAGWVGIQLTPPSMAAPIIILTLAVADCVHILSTWNHARRSATDRNDAMVESLRINFSPVLMTSLTTMIGFLSLNFSDAPPFGDLGNIAAIGVLFAWFYAITLLPALVTLLPSTSRVKRAYGAEIMDWFADQVIRYRRVLMPVVSLVVIALVACIPANQVNDIFLEYFGEEIQFKTDSDFVVDNLTGLYFIDYSLDAGQSGAISEPEYLARVERFAKWLRTQPEVIHVNTLTDMFKRVNKSMHADDPAWYALPEEREMAAQYLLLYEMSLPYGLSLNNQVDIDKKRTRLSVTLETLSTNEVIAFEKRASQWLAQNTPDIQTVGSSPTMMFAHIGMRNIIGMLSGTAFAVIAISLLLMWAFQSVRCGLITLIPNFVPAAMAFGFWGIVNGNVGVSLSLVTAMTLGIVVDDTIHFMSKYVRARQESRLDAADAVRYAFSTVGVALWTTSLALAVGFLVLSTSPFLLNAQMGFVVADIIMFALFVDFLLLPMLLIRIDKWLLPEAVVKPAARR